MRWTYVPTSEALSLRKGEGGLLFNRVLEEKLIELNPGLVTSDNVASDDVGNGLEKLRGRIAEAEECYDRLKAYGFTDGYEANMEYLTTLRQSLIAFKKLAEL